LIFLIIIFFFSPIDKSLSGLHALIEQRLSTFTQLLKLSGRLDIILSQIATKEKLVSTDFKAKHVFVDGKGILEMKDLDEEEEEEEEEVDSGDESDQKLGGDEENEGYIHLTPEQSDEDENEDGVMYMTPEQSEASSASENEDEEMDDGGDDGDDDDDGDDSD
jgi:U3 small nucleolar RNA-associated protein 5